MITKEQELQVLNELDDLGVLDVYFHKGQLHIINDYDVDTVMFFLEDLEFGADVEVRLPDHEPLY